MSELGLLTRPWTGAISHAGSTEELWLQGASVKASEILQWSDWQVWGGSDFLAHVNSYRKAGNIRMGEISFRATKFQTPAMDVSAPFHYMFFS